VCIRNPSGPCLNLIKRFFEFLAVFVHCPLKFLYRIAKLIHVKTSRIDPITVQETKFWVHAFRSISFSSSIYQLLAYSTSLAVTVLEQFERAVTSVKSYECSLPAVM